jgi:hypothetical protein
VPATAIDGCGGGAMTYWSLMGIRFGFFLAGCSHRMIEHDPEKACPARDAGWVPVFGNDHAPGIN